MDSDIATVPDSGVDFLRLTPFAGALGSGQCFLLCPIPAAMQYVPCAGGRGIFAPQFDTQGDCACGFPDRYIASNVIYHRPRLSSLNDPERSGLPLNLIKTW